MTIEFAKKLNNMRQRNKLITFTDLDYIKHYICMFAIDLEQQLVVLVTNSMESFKIYFDNISCGIMKFETHTLINFTQLER